jgi:hypothetical protein
LADSDYGYLTITPPRRPIPIPAPVPGPLPIVEPPRLDLIALILGSVKDLGGTGLKV